MGKTKKGSKPANPKPREAKDRKVWKDDEKLVVIDTMKDENAKGRRSENGWKTQSYARAADNVNKLHPEEPPVNAGQVKSALSRASHSVEGEFKICKKLRFQGSGFGWDEGRKAVTAEPAVKAAYLEKFPSHAKFFDKGFPFYDEIAEIIEGTIATGAHAVSSRAQPRPASPDIQIDPELLKLSDSTPDPSGSSADRPPDGEREVSDESDSSSESDELDSDSDAPTVPKSTRKRVPATPIAPTAPPASTPSGFPVSSASVGGRQRHPGRQSGVTVMGNIGSGLEHLAAVLHADAENGSPVRRKRAFDMFLAEDGDELSDTEFAGAVALISETKYADQYSAFPSNRKRARTIWLRTELDKRLAM